MRYSAFVNAALLSCAIISWPAHAESGDAKAGEVAFDVCTTCHSTEKDAGNDVGPNLFGVVGRKSASAPNFDYSAPLKASGITWTNERLSEWLADPVKMVPGTSMGFPGITSKDKIRDLIAYMDTLK